MMNTANGVVLDLSFTISLLRMLLLLHLTMTVSVIVFKIRSCTSQRAYKNKNIVRDIGIPFMNKIMTKTFKKILFYYYCYILALSYLYGALFIRKRLNLKF